MKIINISNWHNNDMQSVRGYVSSYTLSENGDPLFNIDLLKQKGFYQLSEFTAPDGQDHFMIEQTNRAGTPKVAAFDKQSGAMLGAFKANRLINSDEDPVFNIHNLSQLTYDSLAHEFAAGDDDFIAVSNNENIPVALFIRLPKKNTTKTRILSKIRTMANHITHTHREVMQLVILEKDKCDERMLYVIATVLHDRGGLQLK